MLEALENIGRAQLLTHEGQRELAWLLRRSLGSLLHRLAEAVEPRQRPSLASE